MNSDGQLELAAATDPVEVLDVVDTTVCRH
jgi:hypothetical protein